MPNSPAENAKLSVEDLAARFRGDELAARIAAQAPVAVQVAKELIDATRPRTSLEALGGGLTAFTDDAREGQAAFRERRTPEYGGS